MNLETISNRILNSNFGLTDQIEHSDGDSEVDVPTEEVNEHTEQTDSVSTKYVDQINSVSVKRIDKIKMEVENNDDSSSSEDNSDSLTHHGVLGMKWGVRKDRYAKVKKRDRRYEGESDQDYQRRMERESQERKAKTEAKAREKQQKREIKDRAATQKRMLKSQEKQQKIQIKAQEKQRKDQQKAQEKMREDQQKAQEKMREDQRAEQKLNAKKKSKTKTVLDSTKTMTDQELNDAINRLRREQEYKNLIKKPDGLAKKTIKGVASIGGGIMLAVGKGVVTKQLTKYANAKIDDYAKKKGFYRPDKPDNQQSDQQKKKDKNNTIDVDFTVVDEALKKYLGG